MPIEYLKLTPNMVSFNGIFSKSEANPVRRRSTFDILQN